MLGSVRRQHIIDRLAIGQQVHGGELARELGTSLKTIGRDLEQLERNGQIRRVHGGAIAVSLPHLPPIDAPRTAAARAASLTTAGSFVFLGGGSTILALVVRLFDLPARSSLVTTMLDIALILGRERRHEVRMPAGVLGAATRCLGGPDYLRFLDTCAFDFAVLGTTGIDLARGVMGPTSDHVLQAECLRRRSHRLMIVADGSKFGKTDRYRVCGLGDIHVLVSDRPVPQAFKHSARSSELRIVDGDE